MHRLLGWNDRGVVRSAVAVVLTAATLAACSSSSTSPTSASGPKVLLVGTYRGKAGQYTTVEAAVKAARPGDWVLIAPGDYHVAADHTSPVSSDKVELGANAGLLITTPKIHLRGMDRNKVIIDGDLPSAPTPCDPAAKYQDLGTKGADGKAQGRNGVVVFQTDGVSVENLTTCNFLAGSKPSGNEIWWNGGDGSGTIGMVGYTGRYLTATSTYFGTEDTAAQYGIFASNAAGPALLDQTYASNFNDSGMYIGACQQVCDVTVDHAWLEYSALGYSGTNSGGAIVIKRSEFDNNEDGFDTNTSISGDPTAPQDGACPNNGISPITHTHSCWVFMDNNVHDNNNPNTPRAGSAAAGPYGTGMTIAGARNDTIMHNTFSNNGAWGLLVVPYPDSGTPSPGQSCAGFGGVQFPGLGCVLDSQGNAILNNTFSHNGYFGNPSNSDFGQITLTPGQPRNCFSGNVAPDSSAPADLEQIQPTCGPLTTAGNTGGALLVQVLCDSGFGDCPAGAHYPTPTKVVMAPLPSTLATMPNPCQGVPANPWC